MTLAHRFGGLVLTHNEIGATPSSPACLPLQLICEAIIASDSGEGAILPTWTAVDENGNNVRTQRELMEHMRDDGWNVDVCDTSLVPRTYLPYTAFNSTIGALVDCCTKTGLTFRSVSPFLLIGQLRFV